MPQTSWSPALNIPAEEWLLSDGSIVSTPPLEESTSGRRVRLAGTNQSVGSRSIRTLLREGVEAIATKRGTSTYLQIFSDTVEMTSLNNKVNQITGSAPKIDFTPPDMNTANRLHLTATWKFRHPTLPINAYFVAHIHHSGYSYILERFGVWRNTHPTMSNQCSFTTRSDGRFVTSQNDSAYASPVNELDSFYATNPSNFDNILDRRYTSNTSFRRSMQMFLNFCKEINEKANIELPIWDPNAEKFVLTPFVPVHTNFSNNFHQEIQALLQVEPVLQRIGENYQTLINDLALLGTSISWRNKIDPSKMQEMLSTGDLSTFIARVVPQDGEESWDTKHVVSLNLATGTVAVTCPHNQDLDEVAQAWKVAKFKAELTGEVDVLLQYAQAYNDPKERQRIAKIIAHNKGDN